MSLFTYLGRKAPPLGQDGCHKTCHLQHQVKRLTASPSSRPRLNLPSSPPVQRQLVVCTSSTTVHLERIGIDPILQSCYPSGMFSGPNSGVYSPATCPRAGPRRGPICMGTRHHTRRAPSVTPGEHLRNPRAAKPSDCFRPEPNPAMRLKPVQPTTVASDTM